MNDPRLAPLFEHFDKLASAARRHTPGGVLLADDLIGIYRRAAREFGCTPEDAKRWIEERSKP